MIDKSKTYRTRDGREVRLYATDGAVIGTAGSVHGAFKSPYGWEFTTWYLDGRWMRNETGDGDLIEADPHGILPCHRELLAAEFEAVGQPVWARIAREDDLESMLCIKAALIAIAKLDAEKVV